MVRLKQKDGIKTNFNLEKDIVERLRALAKFEGTNQSNFIEMLVSRWDEGVNPEAKLNKLLKERDDKDLELKRIDKEIKVVSDQIIIFNDLRRQKLRRKPEALGIIQTKLLNEDIAGAEQVAKVWQTNTGVSAFDLLMEAKDNIQKEGI